jgi:hypothetical protein
MWSPGPRGRILAEYMSFGGSSATQQCQENSAAVAGILDSGGLVAIFTGPEPAGFCYLGHLASQSPGDASL